MMVSSTTSIFKSMPVWVTLIILLSLFSCRTTTSPSVKIAAHVWPGYELLFLARSLDWLDANRVELVETESASASMQAFREGKVDAAALTLDEVLHLRAEGHPVTVVLVFNISAGADKLLVKPDITSLQQLEGKRLGYEAGAVGELMLMKLLAEAGLSREQLQLVPISIDLHYEYFTADRLDAVISYSPVSNRLLAENAVNLFDSRQLPDTIFDVLAVRTDRLNRQRRHALRQIIEAHFRARDYFNHNPYDSAYRMNERFQLPAAAVLDAYRGLILPDKAHNYRLLSGHADNIVRTATMINLLLQSQGVANADSLDGLIDAALLPTDFVDR